MQWQLPRKKRGKEGLEEGRKEGIFAIAKKMKQKGFDIETIVETTDLTKDQVEKL